MLCSAPQIRKSFILTDLFAVLVCNLSATWQYKNVQPGKVNKISKDFWLKNEG